MTPHIKNRIEQIRRGEVPEGYRETEVGVMPEEWETFFLGELFSERNKANLAHLQLLSITSAKGVIPRSEIEGKDNSSEDKSKYKHICVGDIGYNTMRMWQGVSALSSLDGIVSPAYTILKPDKSVSAEYGAYLFKLQSMIDLFYRHSQGLVDDTRSLKYEWFQKIKVAFPPLLEQEKIAEILKTQDRVIELCEKKVEQLKKLKKVFLQKMFPKPGASAPEWRFPGFTDAWEQRKLADLAEIVGGGTPDTNNPAYWDGDIDWYAPAEMEGQRYASGSIRKITELGLQKSSAKVLPAYRTVLFTSRAGIGKMAILQRPAATNQGFQSMVLKDGTDPYFIYSMGEIFKDMAVGVASGSTFLEISGKMLGSLEVMVPILDEQKQIASFFRSIDDLITLHQRKCDEEKQKKKALMQLLLTGIVRVKK